MIKKTIAAAFLLTCGLCAFAAISDDPDDKFDKLFVGQFGEVISFRKDMSVLARSQGNMEIVDFYRPDRYENDHLIRFDPAKVKLTPEVFVKEDLIELIVAPVGASQYSRLADLRAVKEAELRKQGVEYKVIEVPYPMGRFSPGSFEVKIEKPYRLSQLYTETAAYRFILTARDYPAYFEEYSGTVRISLAELVSKSLATQINRPAQPKATPGQYIQHETQLWLHDWIFFEAVFLLLAVIMQAAPSFPRLRWSLTALFAASSLGSITGWVLGQGFIHSPELSRYWFGPTAVACLVLLFPIGILMERASGRKLSRVGSAVLGLYALIIFILGWSLQETTPSIWLELMPLYSLVLGGVAAAPIGLIWGAVSDEGAHS